MIGVVDTASSKITVNHQSLNRRKTMTTKKTTNYFTELDMVDVTKHIEKKGQFS
jgi:hypothetical protein